MVTVRRPKMRQTTFQTSEDNREGLEIDDAAGAAEEEEEEEEEEEDIVLSAIAVGADTGLIVAEDERTGERKGLSDPEDST